MNCGTASIVELRKRSCDQIPQSVGVYRVKAPERFEPKFIERGRYRHEHPHVPIDELRDRWRQLVCECHDHDRTIYYGSTDRKRGGLRARVHEYLRFDQGEVENHVGGRYIWHLVDSDVLQVFWCGCAQPGGDEESRLLWEFRGRHGGWPFANLKRPGSDPGGPTTACAAFWGGPI